MSPRQTILVTSQSNVATTTGGSITIFKRFCNMLARQGYNVIGTCHSDCPDRPAGLDESIRFVNTSLEYDGVTACRDAFNKLVEEISPDLIVFFFAHDYLEVHLQKRFRYIPRILMFHMRPDYFFTYKPSLKRRLRKYYINTTAQVLMESFKDLLPRYMKRGPVAVIPNGVESQEACVDYGTERRKMIFFSRIDRAKGVDILIDAMAIIAKKYPDWSIDLYGDTEPEAYGDMLRRRVATLNLEKNVRFMGVTRQIGETLRQYDICLFPSRTEGMSLGLAESMAAGLPCVGFNNASGVNEMLIHGVSGLLCDDNAESLAQAAIRLIENPEERKLLGLNARRWVSQYDPEVVDMKWLSLIDTILNKGGKPALLPASELVRLYSTPVE
ncbi:MAG: glycosyltransferase [Bacteroidales bacterium]|nr:glycosyltransferase [Bacteroidales bacterium]